LSLLFQYLKRGRNDKQKNSKRVEGVVRATRRSPDAGNDETVKTKEGLKFVKIRKIQIGGEAISKKKIQEKDQIQRQTDWSNQWTSSSQVGGNNAEKPERNHHRIKSVESSAAGPRK